MEDRRFDELTKVLAAGRSRRAVLGAVVAGAAAAVAGGARVALADRAPRHFRPPRRCGRGHPVPCGTQCCRPGDACAPGQGCFPADGAVCGSGYCAAGEECAGGRCNVCSNRDGACGGECLPCPLGATCHADADCVSDVCISHKCRECRTGNDCPEARIFCEHHACVECVGSNTCEGDRPICAAGACRACQDGLGECLDADPTKPVCAGGVCRACQANAECEALFDVGFTCHDGACVGHCVDGRTNFDETDVDCGGSCPPCAVGKRCIKNEDCDTLACFDGVCGCEFDADCAAGSGCHGHRCVPDHCGNGRQDGDETGVDCGGSCPTRCGTGQGCQGDGDCQSGVCDPNTLSCLASDCPFPDIPEIAVCCADPASCAEDGEPFCLLYFTQTSCTTNADCTRQAPEFIGCDQGQCVGAGFREACDEPDIITCRCFELD